MPLNTVNPYQITMTAKKVDQSVPESVDGRCQHENRVKDPITTNDQYLLYPKNDRGPYNDNEAVLGGRNKNENLYDYPANDRGYDIQGPQGQFFQQFSIVWLGHEVKQSKRLYIRIRLKIIWVTPVSTTVTLYFPLNIFLFIDSNMPIFDT